MNSIKRSVLLMIMLMTAMLLSSCDELRNRRPSEHEGAWADEKGYIDLDSRNDKEKKSYGTLKSADGDIEISIYWADNTFFTAYHKDTTDIIFSGKYYMLPNDFRAGKFSIEILSWNGTPAFEETELIFKLKDGK